MVRYTFMWFCARKYDILNITTDLFVPSWRPLLVDMSQYSVTGFNGFVQSLENHSH